MDEEPVTVLAHKVIETALAVHFDSLREAYNGIDDKRKKHASISDVLHICLTAGELGVDDLYERSKKWLRENKAPALDD